MNNERQQFISLANDIAAIDDLGIEKVNNIYIHYQATAGEMLKIINANMDLRDQFASVIIGFIDSAKIPYEVIEILMRVLQWNELKGHIDALTENCDDLKLDKPLQELRSVYYKTWDDQDFYDELFNTTVKTLSYINSAKNANPIQLYD